MKNQSFALRGFRALLPAALLAAALPPCGAIAEPLTGTALHFSVTGDKVWGGVCLSSPAVNEVFTQTFTSAAIPPRLRDEAQCASNDGRLSIVLRHRYDVFMVGDWEVSWNANVIGDARATSGLPIGNLWAEQPPEPFSMESYTSSGASGAEDDEYALTQGVDVGTITVAYVTTRSAQCLGDLNHNFSAQDFLNDTTTSLGGVYLQWPASYAGESCSLDTDGDSVNDAADNCTEVDNPDQRDTDGDGYGNLCDADLNDDGIVNAGDLAIMKLNFFTGDPDADLDGDGVVGFTDLGLIRSLFFQAPGPSGLNP